MPDLQQPIVVPASPGPMQIASAVRSLALVIGALTGLAQLLSAHDVNGLVAYVQSAPFLTAASIVSGAVAFIWGQWKLRKRAVESAKMATILPNNVAVTK